MRIPIRSTHLVRYGALAIAATAVTTLAGAPATAAAGSQSRQMRHYDSGLLKDTNSVRAEYGTHDYRANHKLWRISHAYAEHLAATGQLVHNPNLESEVSRACPDWTSLGENIGVSTGGGSGAHQMFEAYMHSPPHRANLLDSSYRQVGIATVKVTRHGKVQKWNVMDFANHCH